MIHVSQGVRACTPPPHTHIYMLCFSLIVTLDIKKKQNKTGNEEKKRAILSTVDHILNSLLSMCVEDASYAWRRFVSVSVCVSKERV